jgi:hypothetical protein
MADEYIDIAYCADEDTEILTRRGWASYRDVAIGEDVLTLDHMTGESEWQPVLDLYVFPGRPREMIAMEGATHSSLTTPNHRWPVERRRRRTGTERQKTARGTRAATGRAPLAVTVQERLVATSETLGYWDRIPIAARCASLPREATYTDAFVELVAWFWTEGSVVRPRNASITQGKVNPEYLDRIRRCLRAVFGEPTPRFPRMGRKTDGIPRWREIDNGHKIDFYLSVDAAATLLAIAPRRVVAPSFLAALTQQQLDLFIETSMAADNAGEWTIAQRDRAMAESFQIACTLAGRATTLRPSRAGMWVVTIRRQRYLHPRAAVRAGGRFTITCRLYDGEVWCPRTANGTWLARRRGTVYFTGNSLLVCPHGYVFQGRGRRNESGANGTVATNERFLALCYIGNGTAAVREPAVEAYRELIAHVRERYPQARRIIGHRDIKATSCPGDALYDTMRSGVLDPDRALEYYVVVRKRRPFTPSRVVSFARRGGGRGEALARGTDWVLLANRNFRVSFRLVKRRRSPAVGRRL